MAKPTKCHTCGASAAEIRAHGHRRRMNGQWVPREAFDVGGEACPQACTCLPEHITWAEHVRECHRS
jgi:hypothetical protein